MMPLVLWVCSTMRPSEEPSLRDLGGLEWPCVLCTWGGRTAVERAGRPHVKNSTDSTGHPTTTTISSSGTPTAAEIAPRPFGKASIALGPPVEDRFFVVGMPPAASGKSSRS